MLRNAVYILCVLFILVGAYAEVRAAEKSLAAYWAFEEGRGNITEDLSGNSNTGNIGGHVEWVDGIIGKAIECNGSTIVDCGKGESLEIPQNITTEFWINPTEDIGPENSRINVLYMHWGPMFAFCTGWGAAGALTYWYDGPTPKPTIHSKTAKWEKGRWYYIVGTYDGSVSKLYVNAEIEASINCKGDILERDQSLKIGQTYIGIIDEVKIYVRALSKQEIDRNYRLGLTGGEAVDTAGKLPLTWGWIKRLKSKSGQ
jgi:hypothetical protein